MRVMKIWSILAGIVPVDEDGSCTVGSNSLKLRKVPTHEKNKTRARYPGTRRTPSRRLVGRLNPPLDDTRRLQMQVSSRHHIQEKHVFASTDQGLNSGAGIIRQEINPDTLPSQGASTRPVDSPGTRRTHPPKTLKMSFGTNPRYGRFVRVPTGANPW